MKLPVSQVEPPPNVFAENEITYVTGVGKLKNRLIILVDLQQGVHAWRVAQDW